MIAPNDVREGYRNAVVSSGTHRNQDLLPAFLGALDDLDPGTARALRAEYAPVLQAVDDGSEPDPDATQWLYEALYDALDAAGPDGTYFGAIEGDGACFGFWEFDPEEGRISLETLLVSLALILGVLLMYVGGEAGLPGGPF